MLGTANALSSAYVRQVVHRAGLELVGAEIAVQRRVERVEPDDRRVAAVHVLVPGPARRDHEVAFLHRAVFAVDDGGGAVAFDHEAQRVHGVAVRPRLLAGKQDLQRGGEIGGGAAAAADSVRIGEGQHPPLDRGRRGDLHGIVDQRTDLLPAPVGRRGAALTNLVRGLILPQRREVRGLPGLADFLVGPAAGRWRQVRCAGIGCTHGASPRRCGHYSRCARGASAPRGWSGDDGSEAGGTADAVHDALGIRGHVVAAPGDVAVRPHQHQAGFIERGDLRIGEGDGAHRHAARRGGLDQPRGVGRIGAEPQQHEAVAEQVERRASVVQPGMRRARAGPRRRHEARRVHGDGRRAIRHADRRVLVAVVQLDVLGDREPGRLGLPVGHAVAPAGNGGDGVVGLGREPDIAHARSAAARSRRRRAAPGRPSLRPWRRASSRD